MVFKCKKCGKIVPEDSIYCPYCGYGIKSSAKTVQVSAGGTLLIAAAVVALIFFALSVKALAEIYSWYPPVVAQGWIAYDQMLTIFSFTGFLSGFSAGALALAGRRYLLTIVFTIICTFSGAGAWIISMIIPWANVGYSLFYYFLPVFSLPLIGALLIYPRKAEFRE
jgi:hypothetical protein